MKANFVFFPTTRDKYSKCCRYSPEILPEAKEFHFSKDECAKVLSLWNDQTAIDGRTGGDVEGQPAKKDKRISRLNFLGYDGRTSWIYEKLFRCVKDANDARFNFDLSGFFEDLQLTRYESNGGHYDWHEDQGVGQFSIRKLSIVVQLTDPKEYEGGDLEIHGEGAAERTQGTVFVFPSFVTHRVLPITKGQRHSLVAWISGTPFR